MAGTAKRRFFRVHFHISTAFVMMLAASGLLYLNLIPYKHAHPEDECSCIQPDYYGFPVDVLCDAGADPQPDFSLDFSDFPSSVYFSGPSGLKCLDVFKAFVDALVAAAVLAGTGVLCEVILRRRERRKTETRVMQ